MEDRNCWVDGWEVRRRPDGSFGVYDYHGLLAGPYASETEAMAAAMKLPHPAGTMGKMVRSGEPVSD